MKKSPFIVAEISGNHKQSLDRAFKLVDAAAKAGADAIKLQTFKPEGMTLNINKGEFVLKDKKPDLILSGVNRGHNISGSVLYSGTIGAAIEGSLHNIKSIALSQSYSDKSLKSL